MMYSPVHRALGLPSSVPLESAMAQWRSIRDQAHDDAYWEAQLQADRARLASWLATGRLIIHDRRHWELT